MKNNRLTNNEIFRIRSNIEEIKRLSKMESCSFKDSELVKTKELKLWLQWFYSAASNIENIINTNI